MRIGYFTDAYSPAIDGIGRSIDLFGSHLESHGHQVFVVAPGSRKHHYEESDGVISLPSVPSRYFDHPVAVFSPRPILRRLERLRLDLIHIHTQATVGCLGMYVAKRTRSPLISTWHTDLFKYVTYYPLALPGVLAVSALVPSILPGHRTRLRQLIAPMKPSFPISRWNTQMIIRAARLLHQRCDLVIVPSDKTRMELYAAGIARHVEVVPTGVDALPVDQKDVERYRCRWQLPADSKVILFVGRLGREKNVELLLRAFRHVAPKAPDARLLLVGDHRNKRHLLALSHCLGVDERTHFVGTVPNDDIGAIYALATIFAYPSSTDTQALVLNEAAHAGLPVVMTDNRVSNVMSCGRNCLIAGNSEEDFADKLLRLLQDRRLRHRMSKASRQLAANVSIRSQGDRLEALYEGVMRATRGQGSGGPLDPPASRLPP